MRQYVLVGSIFLTGCVGLPVSEAPQEPSAKQTTQEVADQVDEIGKVVTAGATATPLVEEQSTPAVVKVETSNETHEIKETVAVVSESSVPKTAVGATASSDQSVAQQAPPSEVQLLPQPRKDMQPTNAVSHWLAQAEKAYAKDHLTTPASDNAYAYYGRVLLQEPDNQKALAGLEKIVQRYLHLALSSQRKGKAKQAKLFLQRANKVVPSHRDIALVEVELVRIAASSKSKTKPAAKLSKKRQPPMKFAALQTQQQSVIEAPEGMQRQRILLPPSALQLEAPALAIYLRKLARQIEHVDGRLFIIAPKDKQVRWVYSLLNGTNPDYRIRANMKHKKPAAIEVMYSGDEPLLDVFK